MRNIFQNYLGAKTGIACHRYCLHLHSFPHKHVYENEERKKMRSMESDTMQPSTRDVLNDAKAIKAIQETNQRSLAGSQRTQSHKFPRSTTKPLLGGFSVRQLAVGRFASRVWNG